MLQLCPVDPSSDLEALFDVAYACDAAAVTQPETNRADLRAMLTSPEADLAEGTRMLVGEDGVAGFVLVEVGSHDRKVFLDTYVHPDRDQAAWDQLLAHGMDFARRHVVALPDEQSVGWSVGAGSYAQHQRYADELVRWGMARVRRFHRMEILFDGVRPDPPVPPEGVRLQAAGDDESLLRTAHDVFEESFVHHWEHVARPYEDFIAGRRAGSYDPAQWWIAWVGDEPAGVSFGDDTLAELGLGHVSTLGVLPRHRGRGLATLLLRQAFAQAAAAGRRGVRLGVDSENETGALQLYTSVGMSQVLAIDAWSRPLP